MQPVLVTVVPDPDGVLSVLLQLPDAYLLMCAADARNIAAALTLSADELDAAS